MAHNVKSVPSQVHFITIIPNTNSEDVEGVVNYLLSVSIMAGVNETSLHEGKRKKKNYVAF